MVKIFVANGKGKIELSQEELEALLKEAYEDGHKDGIRMGELMTPNYTPITIPKPLDIYYTTTTSTPKPDNPAIITANNSNNNCEYINNIKR